MRSHTLPNLLPSRRDALRMGGASLLSLALGKGVDAAENQREENRRKYKKLLWLWADGGPSGHEGFDPKPQAPHEYSGPFEPANTSQDGVQISSLFGRTAKQMHETVLLRGRYTRGLEHLAGMKQVLGKDDNSNTNALTQYASQGNGMPYAYLECPDAIDRFNYRGEAFLAQRSHELKWNSKRNTFVLEGFHQPHPRIRERMALHQELEAAREQDKDPKFAEWKRLQAKAFELTSKPPPSLAASPNEVDAYCGKNHKNASAQSILMARQLIRSDLFDVILVRFGDFDVHNALVDRLIKDVPPVDYALARLIQEVRSGALGDVLVVFGGEFGRTPRINSSGGRDHWSTHTTMLVSSDNDLIPGCVHGATDRKGAEIIDGEVNDTLWLKTLEGALLKKKEPAVMAGLPPIFTGK